MTLLSSILALALIGAEDPQPPSQPRIPRSHSRIEISIGRRLPSDLSLCKVVVSCKDRSTITDGGLTGSGACALLEEICANICPEGLVDEMTVAAYAPSTEGGEGSTPPPTMPNAAKPSHGRREGALLSSSLPMTMPTSREAAPCVDPEEATETWPMTLREAIRIALDNSEIVRVIAFGKDGKSVGGFEPTALNSRGSSPGEETGRAPVVIARLNADASLWRFKAEVMAEVRSVEQQYWNLAQAHVQLWCADRAVSMAREVLNREQAELILSRGTVADVAEAAQRLEQFNLDLVTRTSDVITTERQLRNLLGLPPADNRRIIPVTPTTEARIEPDWDSSLAEMLDSQPDIAQQKTIVRIAELQLLVARNQILPTLSLNALSQLNGFGQQLDSAQAVMARVMIKALEPVIANWGQPAALDQDLRTNKNFVTWEVGGSFQIPMGTGRSPLANTRQAQYVLLRSRAYYNQVVHQTTHSLARFFLEIDANYKQFQTARRLREAATQRLDAQRAYYEEGRITVDRFLDAISQYTTAVSTEAQYKTTYNISIAALEEAKGTLLAYDNIVIAEQPHPRKATRAPLSGTDRVNLVASKPDNQVVTAAFTDERPKDLKVPQSKPESCAGDSNKPALPAAKTWTFSLSIGGANPVQIKGTITASEGTPAPAGK